MINIDVLEKNQTEDLTEQLQSFDKLVADNERRIFNTIYSFLGDYDDALDLTQETFICAFRSISEFRQESSVSTWLYTIALNICRKHHIKRKRRSSILISSIGDPKINTRIMGQTIQAQSIEYIVEMNEEQSLIRREIDSLPKRYKAVIILRYLQNLSYKEISEIVGCNIGTVKSRLCRARDKLKPKLERLMEVC